MVEYMGETRAEQFVSFTTRLRLLVFDRPHVIYSIIKKWEHKMVATRERSFGGSGAGGEDPVKVFEKTILEVLEEDRTWTTCPLCRDGYRTGDIDFGKIAFGPGANPGNCPAHSKPA